MKQKHCTALAGNGTGTHGLLHFVDARKPVVMISDDKIASEKTVGLNGVEALRTGVSPNSMHYEINVIGKLLDLGMVAVRAAVLNCKGGESERRRTEWNRQR